MINKNITFQPIEEKDLPFVLEIYNWYVQHSIATFHTHNLTVDALKTFLHLHHPIYASFLIHHNKEIAGYCFLTPYKPREAYKRTAEVSVYLKQNFVGKGLGKKALKHLEQHAKTTFIKNLMGIITLENEGSVQLFKKCAYRKCAHFEQVGEKFGRVLDVAAYQKNI